VSPAAAPAPAGPAAPLHVVVMGVSGCGKTSVGQRVARALGLDFVEGDDLHPPRNVALMAAGTPLTDADRSDWLAAVAARLGMAHAAGLGLVVSCSALKRSYRDRLRAACPGLRFVHLHGDADLLRRRLAARTGHYMPATLLDSQLATLELPGADEAAIRIDVSPPSDQVAATALAQLRAPALP
jgi:carbohydrate kinase (thermoresistant glucokinase family)